MAPTKIALLEDDEMFAASARHWLESAGYQVTHFSLGRSCIEALEHETFDVCLFDWQLPGISGPEVMAELQRLKRLPPAIFLSSVEDAQSVAQMLTAGADDYMVKPPVFALLHARIQALLRRVAPKGASDAQEILGELVVNHSRRTVERNGALVPLTAKEADLLFYLLAHRGQLLSRDRLNAVVKSSNLAVDTRRLDVYTSHLRSKLGLVNEHGWKLSSVYGQGYRLEFLL